MTTHVRDIQSEYICLPTSVLSDCIVELLYVSFMKQNSPKASEHLAERFHNEETERQYCQLSVQYNRFTLASLVNL